MRYCLFKLFRLFFARERKITFVLFVRIVNKRSDLKKCFLFSVGWTLRKRSVTQKSYSLLWQMRSVCILRNGTEVTIIWSFSNSVECFPRAEDNVNKDHLLRQSFSSSFHKHSAHVLLKRVPWRDSSGVYYYEADSYYINILDVNCNVMPHNIPRRR